MSSSTLPAVRSFSGDRDHSSFAFAVRHMTVSTFRGALADVDARVLLHPDGAIELRAVVDRRDFGMPWNLPLPRGGDALGHEVEITVALELIAD